MVTTPNIARRLVEVAAAFAVAELVVTVALPRIAPGMPPATKALLDDAIVVLLVGATVLWRWGMSAPRQANGAAPMSGSVPGGRVRVRTVAVLLGGLTMTGIAVWRIADEEYSAARVRFERFKERAVSEIVRSVNLPLHGLKGALAVYTASKSVERDEFRAYVASRHLPREFPGASGFGFITRVRREDLDRFVKAVREDGQPEFAVHIGPGLDPGAGDQPELYIVTFVEPLEPNAASLGRDIGAEPACRAAIERAVRTGAPTISGRVSLAGSRDEPATFMMFVPFYGGKADPSTPEERVAALRGVLYAPIVLERALAALDESLDGLLDIAIFDGEVAAPNLFYDSDGQCRSAAGVRPSEFAKDRMFAGTETFEIAGRTWTVLASTSPKFHAQLDHTGAVAVGMLGLILTALLAGGAWNLGTNHARAEALARQMTAELRAASAASERLAAAVDAHVDAIFLTDAEGRITRVNRAFETMTGYTSAEAVGRTPRILKSGQVEPRVYAELWATILSGKPWSGRLCNRRKAIQPTRLALPVAGAPLTEDEPEGALYWVDASITPLTGADGRLDGFVAVQRDVSDVVRAEMEERLRREDAEARLAVAKSLSGTGALHARVSAALDAIFRMKGLGTQRKGGVFKLAPGESNLRLFCHVGEFSEQFLEHEALVPLGRCLCGRAALNGEIIVSDDCFADRRHETRWPDMKPHGHYIVPLMDRSSESPVCVGVLFLYTDPNPVVTESRLSALREIGELVCVALLQDRAVELASSARAMAEAASRAKSEFLANMSHEIRTPLTAILGFAEMLRDDGNLAIAPEERIQTIDTIRGAGQHLLAVIDEILDLSKIEANKLAVERVEFDLPSILLEVANMVRPRAADKGVQLEATLHSPVPDRIIGDPTRLRQILLNLAGNAVKFTDQGSVQITAGAFSGADGERLAVDIIDTGPGLTSKQVGQLFQPFSQADGSVTRRHGGTGLGLALSRRLAKLMGGELRLVHTSPGQGAHFRVELPLERAPEATNVAELGPRERATERPARPEVRLRGRILLAEDGPDNQRLISFHLKRAGATVDVAENGAAALRMIDAAEAKGETYDLLLTDIQMPELDGCTLASTLRSRGNTIPIVALTAHAMAEDRQRCLDAGCDDYAVKPIDRDSLLATCAAWMKPAARALSEPASA